MNSSTTSAAWKLGPSGFKPMMLTVALGLLVIVSAPVGVANDDVHPSIIPISSLAYGHNYPEWTAKWWQWALSLSDVKNNPFRLEPSFDITMGQSGDVWFLGAPVGGMFERTAIFPYGKALLIAVINAEASDIEGPPFFGETEIEQRNAVRNLVDHNITNRFCIIDGCPINNIERYRVFSPQYTFIASDSNLFGIPGGVEGTSVSDGYWIMLAPLPRGKHTIRFGGAFHFSTAEGDAFDFDGQIDVTYHLIVR